MYISIVKSWNLKLNIINIYYNNTRTKMKVVITNIYSIWYIMWQLDRGLIK